MSGTYVIWPPPPTGGGGGGSGVVTVGSMDAQVASVNGASISGTTIFMQSATGSSTGLVNISAQSFGGKKTFSAGLDSAANAITNVLDPSNPQDAATKNYVDTQLSAFEPKEATYVATIGNLGGVYSNGVAGVGATFTIASTGAFALDGTSPPIGSRILFKDQTTGFQNGVYDLTIVGSGILQPVLTRSLDYNTPAAIDAGDLIPVINGTINQKTSWLQTNNVATVGVDSLIFTQYSVSPLNVPSAMGALDGASASPNAATIGSSSLYLQSASAVNPGIVNSFSQTFAGVKTFNGQIIAPGGVGLSALGTLSLGADANSQFIVIGSGTFSRIGLNMNAPQAAIHYGSLNGNANSTSGTVGSFSIVLGRMSTTNNLGTGAIIIGGFSGAMTASGQGSIAIGDAGCRAEASFAVAIGDGALAQSLASVAIGNGAQVTSAQNNGIAIGASTNVSALSSVAAGDGVSATVAGQTVVGSFNIPSIGAAGTLGSTDEVFVVGAGTGASARTNVLSCTRDGGTRFYTSSGTAYVAIYVGTTTSYAITLPGTQASSSSVLTNNGGGVLAWSPASSSPGSAMTTQTFSSGGGTYTLPAGARAIKITAIGGGAGGGGCSNTVGSQSSAAGGGCGGNTCIKWISTASLSATYAYSVGDKGPAGAAGANAGGAGGNSTFGSVIDTLANNGGTGAVSTVNGQYNPGGVPTASAPTGDLVIKGNTGGLGFAYPIVAASSTVLVSGWPGAGGGSTMSGGVQSTVNQLGNPTSQVGSIGTGYGGGGMGAFSCGSGGFTAAGGRGANGVIIVEEYY